MAILRVGCAIWAYDGWANSFFPPGLPKVKRLAAYAERFHAVEGNTTFYAIPSAATVEGWAAQTPESFRFVPKFPRTITHDLLLENAERETAAFIEALRRLGVRLGPLMIQLPPRFGPDRLAILQSYIARLPDDLAITVEVRHPSWFEAENAARLDAALIEVHAARVIFHVEPAHLSTDPDAVSAQEKKPDVPLVDTALQEFVVVRFISSPVMAENQPYLNQWAVRCEGWLHEGRDVYFFAHCPREELSPEVARALYHKTAARITLPILPWDRIDTVSGSTQLSLF